MPEQSAARIGPGQTLVVGVAKDVPYQELENLRSQLEREFGDRVVVIWGATALAVVDKPPTVELLWGPTPDPRPGPITEE